ncbi:MAG: DUF805 domain-containing protein [Alphaproteobacteria bacterium]|nr:DUF805 domain-containing protein [Alphaproteobacteria bacterium]
MDWMVLPYRRYFDFSGRSRRKEYWMFTLLQILIVATIALLFFSPEPLDADEPPIFSFGIIVIYALFNFIPSLAVQVRRFHDQDMSGWFVLLGFIPYIGGLIVLIFMAMGGTRGPNKYGEDPKQPGINPEVFS